MSEEGETVVIPATAGDDEDRTLSLFSLDLDEAAVIYSVASVIVERLRDGGYQDKPYSSPLPRGFIKAGEASMLMPAVIAMTLSLHPKLLDMNVLQSALMDASLRHKKGKVN